MFNEFDICFGDPGFNINPARQNFVGFGYDKHSYISTAKLIPTAYVSKNLIQARIGGLIKLIEACDDSSPPNGDLVGDALTVYNSVIQNVTTEINGYLSSIYPIPLAQTGTVAVLRVTAVSTDNLGTVTGIEVALPGQYQSAPATPNAAAYLRYLDPLANEHYWTVDWESCQQGAGLSLTVAFVDSVISDETGNSIAAKTVSGVPAIAAGGTGYEIGQLLVLVGGASFVPAKVRESALVLICHSLYQRRLALDEKNPFADLAKFWREFLVEVGEGNKELDGTYKRFFSAGSMWGTRSVLFGANSL